MENNRVDKDFDVRDILKELGKKKKMSTQPIIEMLTEFQGDFKMFPLKFSGFLASQFGSPAKAIIDVPKDIALTDPKPLREDWVFMTLAFPKEAYRKYLEQKYGKPEEI